jgi:hypothetical protein
MSIFDSYMLYVILYNKQCQYLYLTFPLLDNQARSIHIDMLLNMRER